MAADLGFSALLKRDLKLAFRQKSDVINPLMFFVMVITLFPLGISPDPNELAVIAPGVVWVAALLASMLSMENMFRSDFEDGSLERMLVSPLPGFLIALAKVINHFLVTGLPLVIVSPILAYMLNMPSEAYWVMMISLLLGLPTLSLVGAIGSALTVGLKRGALLLPLLVIPLFIPVLIFGTGAVQGIIMDQPVSGQLSILASLLLFSLASAPFACAASLKISMGNG